MKPGVAENAGLQKRASVRLELPPLVLLILVRQLVQQVGDFAVSAL